MFLDFSMGEVLLTAGVALVVIGPKELPQALRSAGRLIGKARRMSAAVQAGIDNVIRQAETEERERDWAIKRDAVLASFENAPEAAVGGPAKPATADQGTSHSPSAT